MLHSHARKKQPPHAVRVRGCIQGIRMAFFQGEPQSRRQAAVQRSGRMVARFPPFRTMRLFYLKLSALSTAFPNIFVFVVKNVSFLNLLAPLPGLWYHVPIRKKAIRMRAVPEARRPFHVRRGTPGPSARPVYHHGVGHHVFIHIGAAARFYAAGNPHHPHGAGHRGADCGAA